MKLTVVISRNKDQVLRAEVQQGGQRGSNLLTRRMITDVESAKKAATAELQFETGGMVREIDWIVEGE